MSNDHYDVIVVGAGLSGIGAGYHLQANCPLKNYLILEARDSIGGTWDLFRYPGIRSDSDMYTLGYSFRPWREAKSIADGPSILKYVRDTAREHGIDQRIRYKQRVVRATWSTSEGRWTVEVEHTADGTKSQYTCVFLFMCSGYYDYAEGYTPEFAGRDRYKGRIVHPQKWTSDIDYEGKRVVVIGSGATAVTLVPQLAKDAAHVTMLQRSPSYVVSLPDRDRIANGLRTLLPPRAAHAIVRWKNVLFGMLFFRLCRSAPDRMKKRILKLVTKELGADFDVATHFTPRYNPWDQRMCLVPNGDLFAAIRERRVSVVTDEIQAFNEHGIQLRSGRTLEADMIVTATGLNVKLWGGMQLAVDGRHIEPSATMSYKGMMFSDVPNLAAAFGYTNASWTLKCDLTCEYVCRLLNHMDKHGYRQCTPRRNDPSIAPAPWIDFSSGYVQRAVDCLPKQGSKAPWRLYQNYALDILSLRFGSLTDDAMEFGRAPPATSASAISR